MTLLAATFGIAFVVASLVVVIFTRPVDRILKRVVPVDISSAWTRYLQFAIYVVGIGGGVRIWEFEKYLTPVEPYRQVSTAMVLLVFFVFALIAVVIVRGLESRSARADLPKGT
jgi:hypothetical protein